jgi:site-specific DNA recombinase
MKQFYGYIRVSTVKQGEHGVSLEQQREAIERYAQKNSLKLSRWFEEQETAAKRGRPVFTQMLKLLRGGQATGVLIHKIDRSARNLKDWADLGELIDSGMEVHFANESLDLHSRGGRLSADIQAVVAADYIRNLREETEKGFYGRLKQGFYPRPAPLGYRDQGSALAKVADPIQAPLIAQAFELYGSGLYNLDRLTKEMHKLGLRTRAGHMVGKSVLSRILHNPFYTGLIKIEKTGETYEGNHKPIVPVALFKRVQGIINGKVGRKVAKHSFLFRQLFQCSHCGRCLIGEQQKGHTYYRCHRSKCPSRPVREEIVERAVIRTLVRLAYSQEEKEYARKRIVALRENWATERETAVAALKLKLSALDERQNRLTDAYLDQSIEKVIFEQRKTTLLEERRTVQNRIEEMAAPGVSLPDRLTEVVELAGAAYLAYRFAVNEEKRELVKKLSSNRTLTGKSLAIKLNSPFHLIANRFSVPGGRPRRDIHLIWQTLLPRIGNLIQTSIIPAFSRSVIIENGSLANFPLSHN